jgi:hypothetical protein
MGEFISIGNAPMSSNETTKIEPTLTVTDAPSIAAGHEAEADTAAADAKPAGIEIKTQAAKLDEPKREAPKIEANVEAKIEPKIEPKIEATTASKSAAAILPLAPQIEPVVVGLKKPAPAAPARSTRFALLAACVAIAASFGAIGGSLGVAKFGPMISSAPPTVAPVAKEHVAEEVRALKETVAQLRATTKTLNDNFAALKSTVASAGTQNGKIAEALERIEKSQTEQRTTAAAASTTEVTGSIAHKQAVPMVLGDPPTTLKPLTVPGWTLRRVYDGAALLEGRDGIIEVEPGIVAPGLGRIEAIRRQQDGRWVVVTARGLIIGR